MSEHDTTATEHDAKPAVDDVTADLKELKLKKSSRNEHTAPDALGSDIGGADFSGLKKKKKKKHVAVDDFEAKLMAVSKEEDQETVPEKAVEEGDMEKGTGIWAHDRTEDIPYNMLLSRMFTLLYARHPILAGGGAKSFKIPPPQCLREGSKKTVFANIAEICQRLNRTEEHVTQFLLSELGTQGSVDGSRRLIIRGRFQQKQMENVLRRYIVDYVTCRTCRSPDTNLGRGENRLYFVECNSCSSRRSVQPIKVGFLGLVGKRRKLRAG